MMLLDRKIEGRARLESIPDEATVESIFALPSAKELASSSRTSKRFNALADDDMLRSQLVLRDHIIRTIPRILASREEEPGWPKHLYAEVSGTCRIEDKSRQDGASETEHVPLRLRGGAGDARDDSQGPSGSGQEREDERDKHDEVDRNQPWVEHSTRTELPGPSNGPNRGGAAFRIGFAGRHAVRPPRDVNDRTRGAGTQNHDNEGDSGNGVVVGDGRDTGRAVGNHPNPSGGLRGPAFRVGFAGRHAVERSAGRGAPVGAATGTAGVGRSDGTQDSSQREGQAAQAGQSEGVGNHPEPGGAMFRVGFAGRGANRGRGGRQGEDEANGKPW